jgi:ribosomal protein S18 acetylase RimI-like enzyme
LTKIADLRARSLTVATAPWSENRHSDAARLIAASYVDHIDSLINDQYRSPGGARRFLTNIVQYPGCGSFFAPASLVALSRDTGKKEGAPGPRPLGYDQAPLALSGVCLASLVANGVGHITQVCVAPSERGTGLGYELLRRSMVALAEYGCHTVTLTVTTANAEALALYERMGFTCRREFAAYVWDKH